MSRDSQEALLQRLGDAVRTNQRATDAVDEATSRLLGINRTDGTCLDLLDQHGRLTAGDLAREMGLTTGAITAVVDRLENAGYARRVRDPDDRRRVQVELTELARERIWETMGPMVEESRPLMERYDEEQLRMLLEFLELSTELQERHAERLRERLRAQRPGT